MKKNLLALFSSALISLTMVTGITYASDDATTTLTATETPMMSQVQETVLPQEQPVQEPMMSQSTEQEIQSTEQEPMMSQSTEQEIQSTESNEQSFKQNSDHQDNDDEDHNEDDKNTNNDHHDNDDRDNHDNNDENNNDHHDNDDRDNHDNDDKDHHDNDKNHHDDKDNQCGTGVQNGPLGSLDLWIRKGAYINGTNTGNVGDTVNYIITYGNGGSITATGVTITESFPVGFVSTEGLAGWTNVPGTTLYTYTIGTLDPGQSGQILFTGTVLLGTTGGVSIPNIVQVTSSTFEDAILLGNNIASALVTGFGTGDCGCGGTTGSTATGGFYGHVFFDANNNGSLGTGELFASGVTVLLKSGTGVVLQTLITDMSGSYFGDAPVGVYSIQVIPLGGYVVTTLNPETITLLSGLTYNAGDDGLYRELIIGGGPLPIDLWIQKTATVNGNSTGNVGDTVTYTLTYGNTGLDTATGVTIADSFPIGFVTTGGLFSWINTTGNIFTFSVGSLAPGQTGQVSFTGTLLIGTLSGTLIPNIVQITSTTIEDQTTLNDNVSTASVISFGTGNCGCTTGSTGSFQGRVYYDNDNNAVKGGTDTYVGGVTVLIKSLTGLVLMTLTTNESGVYNGVIGSGTYVIQVLPLPGYTVTTANPQTLAIIGNTNTDLGEDGLYKSNGGGGGGGFGGGFTIIVPPVVPTPDKPLIPIGPNPEQPVLPTELLSSGPDLEGIFEESTTAVAIAATQVAKDINDATSIIKNEATSLIQNMPIVLVAKMSSRPLTYVNVLSGFESALSSLSLIIYALVAGFALIILSLYTMRVTTFRMD